MADEFVLPRGAPPRSRGVDAGRGLAWLTEAWRLFARSPGVWILVVLILFAILVVVALVPVVGSLGSHVLFPVFTAGLMLGCRAQDRGEPLSVAHLFAGFSERAGSLFVVGLIYTALMLAIMALVVGVLFILFGAAVLSELWKLGDPFESAALLGGLFTAVMVGALLFLLLYLPLVMAIWFAPALVVLRGAEPLQAMALSLSGCAKNVLPFLIYGIVWIALAFIASLPLMLGWLVLAPVTFASVYTGYCDIYEDPVPPPTGRPPTS
jgi:uncharacterized membrane protein